MPHQSSGLLPGLRRDSIMRSSAMQYAPGCRSMQTQPKSSEKKHPRAAGPQHGDPAGFPLTLTPQEWVCPFSWDPQNVGHPFGFLFTQPKTAGQGAIQKRHVEPPPNSLVFKEALFYVVLVFGAGALYFHRDSFAPPPADLCQPTRGPRPSSKPRRLKGFGQRARAMCSLPSVMAILAGCSVFLGLRLPLPSPPPKKGTRGNTLGGPKNPTQRKKDKKGLNVLVSNPTRRPVKNNKMAWVFLFVAPLEASQDSLSESENGEVRHLEVALPS